MEGEPTPVAQRAPRSLRVRQAAARVAVAASAKTGRPVDPRVKALAEMQYLSEVVLADATQPPAVDDGEEASSSTQRRPARSLRVRKAAARVAVAASAKTGRPVDPRVKALAEMP